jgi:hypothetical protein
MHHNPPVVLINVLAAPAASSENHLMAESREHRWIMDVGQEQWVIFAVSGSATSDAKRLYQCRRFKVTTRQSSAQFTC